METFESWSKGSCLYHCTLCFEEYNDFIEFGHHIEIDHQMSMPTYIQGNMQPMRSNLIILFPDVG